ncbi:MAG: Uma2 family endonuclease [Bacillota bacterium]
MNFWNAVRGCFFETLLTGSREYEDRYSIITETNIQGAPDLVVEVLSPSTEKCDRKEKSGMYFENGVKEYWILDPEIQLLEVFVRGEKNWNRAGVYDEKDTLFHRCCRGCR